jgi:hypothetical protein
MTVAASFVQASIIIASRLKREQSLLNSLIQEMVCSTTSTSWKPSDVVLGKWLSPDLVVAFIHFRDSEFA